MTLHSGHKTSLRASTKQSDTALKGYLDSLFLRFNRTQWLTSDPIRFPHEFRCAQDQEVVAFIAALFSYGSVPLIQRAVRAILTPLGNSPASFLKNYNGENLWPDFCHRFHKEGHIVYLMKVLSAALKEYGSIEGLFTSGLSPFSGPHAWSRTEVSLQQGVSRLNSFLRKENVPPSLVRGFKFLFNSPEGGSACKRLLMFLRWMVRQDDVDLGLWQSLKPHELVIPLDTHVARLSYYLKLRSSPEGRAPQWRMACEVTTALSRLRPEDPVKYDFALARLGILQLCRRQFEKSICERCEIEPACRYSQKKRSY